MTVAVPVFVLSCLDFAVTVMLEDVSLDATVSTPFSVIEDFAPFWLHSTSSLTMPSPATAAVNALLAPFASVTVAGVTVTAETVPALP